jgi:SAM-dependent methyltransferase
MLRTLFNANRRMSRWLEARLPQAKADPYGDYARLVADRMNARPQQLLADIGGGRSCPFAEYRRPELETRIVAVDVSEDEIRLNSDVDETRVADIMQDLPFETSEVDMIVSRSVLEHLDDLEAFVIASKRVLKPGGSFIHVFPNRYALFAVLNRALPHRISQRLLYFFQPQMAGICGFPAFYDRCSYTEIKDLLIAHGFEVERVDVSYYQSRYFDFFFPAFVVSAVYEMIVRALGARDLGAYVTVVAHRR